MTSLSSKRKPNRSRFSVIFSQEIFPLLKYWLTVTNRNFLIDKKPASVCLFYEPKEDSGFVDKSFKQRITNLANGLVMGKLEKDTCHGDFCCFDYDKFEKTYDPIKKPSVMELIKLVQDNTSKGINKPTEEISINVINAIRYNYEITTKVLVEKKLFPLELSHLSYRNSDQKDLKSL